MNMKLFGFVALFVILLSSVASAQNPPLKYCGYVFVSGNILDGLTVTVEVDGSEIASTTVPTPPAGPGSGYYKFENIADTYAGSDATFKVNGLVADEFTLDIACQGGCMQEGCNPNLTVDDTVSPTITDVSTTPNIGTAGVSVTIEATATDTFGVSSVEAQIQKPDGNVVETVTMSLVLGNDYEGTWTSGVTDEDGTYLIDIEATDNVGNSEVFDNGAVVGLGAGSAFTDNSVSISEGDTETIDAESEADVTLEIATNSTVSGSVNIVKYTSTPSIGGSISAMGKYIDIELSQSIKDSLEWIMIKIHYTEAEVAAMGVIEENLAFYWWDESSSQWVKLVKGSPSWVNYAGVDTAANYIWANVSHLSSYTGGGEPSCSDGIQNQGEAGVDCGGPCPNPCQVAVAGVYNFTCEEDWTCTEWSDCSPEGVQTRECVDNEECGTTEDKPSETQTCIPAAPYCGDGTCQADESCENCEEDCGVCPPPTIPTGPVCGDGFCEGGEACETCPEDCGACPGPAITGAITGRITENPVPVIAGAIAIIIVLLVQFKFVSRMRKR